MTHEEKVARLKSDLQTRGVRRRFIDPPIFRWFWAIGIEVPPPLFLNFSEFALLIGLMSGVSMTFFFWLSGLVGFWWRGVAFGVLVGTILGSYFTWTFGRKAKELQLPDWEQYGKLKPPAL